MTRTIEYEGVCCKLYTTEKTTAAPGGPGLPADTVLYAAWRWLGRCRALRRPLTALCLAFRRGLVRERTFLLEVSLPARAAALPVDGRLHLLLELSREGVWLRRVAFSPCPARPGPARRVVFH